MIFLFAAFLALGAIVVVAGIVLAHYADAIAEVTGLGRLLIGSVLLAGATSLPELSVDLAALRLGHPDLAVGDLLGSSLMNLLILAMLDLTHFSRGKMLSRSAAAHALSGIFSIALTGLVGLALLTSKQIPNWTFLGIHFWSWLIAVSYVLGVRMVFLDQRIALRTVEDQSRSTEQKAIRHQRILPAVVGFLSAACVIVIVGPQLANYAGQIAERSGLGDTFVGSTLVALTTSLPELAASLAAIRLGSIDLAIGNVFGSNAFNVLLFLPLDAYFPGAIFTAVHSTHTILALAAMVATCVVIIGQLYQVEERTRFMEPDAIMVIVLIFAALMMVRNMG